MVKIIHSLLFAFSVSTSLLSCVNSREITYMHNIEDTAVATILQDVETVIQKSDLLSISVTSINQEATEIFNVPNNNAIAGTNSSNSNTGYVNQAIGYLVNQKGFIQFPILGNIQAAGLTKQDLIDVITKKLVDNKLLLDPNVTIRYLNYKVTVLGEVGKPMVINVPNERITVLEALGLASDITINGRKDNVLLIREIAGIRTVNRINLNSPHLLSSPYYYLQSNDVIYVEPNKAKVNATSTTRTWLPLAISGLTLVILAADVITNN